LRRGGFSRYSQGATRQTGAGAFGGWYPALIPVKRVRSPAIMVKSEAQACIAGVAGRRGTDRCCSVDGVTQIA
jgi:hypothetical protein